jgi:hypothetical protein
MFSYSECCFYAAGTTLSANPSIFYAAGTTLSANPSIFHKRKFPQLSEDVSHAGNSRYCIIDPHHTLAAVIVRVT